MMRRMAAVGLALLLATASAAQEERAIDHFGGVGGRAMGMGGAFVGVADDFTALWWNPAGLAQIQHRELHAALLRTGHETRSNLSGMRSAADLVRSRFASLGVVTPYPVYRGSLVFAAGIVRLKDFDWTLREQGIDQDLTADNRFSHEGQLTLAALAGAFDVSPSLALGVTVGLTGGHDDHTNEYVWADTKDLFTERRWVARDTYADKYESAPYASLGLMVRSPRDEPRYRLGATLTTGGTQRIAYVFRGATSDQGYDRIEYDDGRVVAYALQTVRASYRLSLPFEFGVGGSLMPVPGLLLAASVHRSEWEQSRYKNDGGVTDVLRANADFAKQYRNTARYHLGAEWQVPTVALDLRAGFYTDPLPFVGPRDAAAEADPVSNPVVTRVQDRRFLTLGAGVLLDEVVQVDLTWNRGTYRQTEGALTESGTVRRLLLGVSYRF